MNPSRHELDGVDDLRVEARGHLDAHEAREEHEVEVPEVSLAVPGDRVVHRHAVDPVVHLDGDADHLFPRSFFPSSFSFCF